MVDVMVVRKVALPIALVAVAIFQCACAATHEEPPAPPPPPVDPAAFNSPARPPAQSADLSRDLDAGDPFADAAGGSMTMNASDAGPMNPAVTADAGASAATKPPKTKKP
ncbi:MAG TPA: hypothetical protein VGI39_31145 [Polyangiaceae bacterium]|jgi:hypothetical protein